MKYRFYNNGHTIEEAAINARGQIVLQHHVADFKPGFEDLQNYTTDMLNADLNARGELSRKEIDFDR